MNYINTEQAIFSAQGVSKRPLKFTKFEREYRNKLDDAKTQKQARPPQMTTKNKIGFLSFQPL